MTKATIVKELLKKYPNSSSHQIARIAFSQNPTEFRDRDSARDIVRYYRGAKGSNDRRHATVQPSPFSTGTFKAFPEGSNHFDKEWIAEQISGQTRTLILSDLHIPYHQKGPVMLALEYGRTHKADTIILNGDIADFYSCSFWETDPKKRNLAEELRIVREFLVSLRNAFPKARIIYKAGNHEERWKRFIIHKAPEVYGIEEFSLPSLLQLEDVGMEFVGDNRPIRLGMLNVLHGHEYNFAISNPVNPARGLFLRAKASAMCGHFHQSSYHAEKNVNQESMATWSIGCLCGLHPDYRPLNNWGYGFAFVETDKAGKFDVSNKVIRGGKVY
jgi:predicted phosphodiesterase